MSTTVDVEAMSPQDRARYERKREHEFYSYYEPLRILAGPDAIWTDLNSSETDEEHTPTSSTDKALTAFCQLAALRLKARRAMIFCFDSQHAYVLGEATQTLSFEDDGIHHPGDGLWLGMTKIPLGSTVCEHTVNLPNNLGSNAQDQTGAKIHVVNDLSEDVRFFNQPYVAGGIKARFYAGVPITTAKGFNIGAFKLTRDCNSILDDKPRDGLETKDVRFLQEMGSLVMEHLAMLKARAEQRRGTLMVKALNSFMENEPGVRDEPLRTPPTASSETLEAIAQATELANADLTELTEHDMEQLTLQHKLEDENALLTTGRTLNSLVAESNNTPPIPSETVRPPMSRRDSTKSNAGLATKKEEDPLKLRDQIASNAMQSAADFIRTAVGADGVLFLDASMSNFGELADEAIDVAKPGREPDLFTSDTEGAGSATDTLDKPDNQEDVSKPCSVFGASYGLVPASFTPPHAEVPKKLLQSLLRCHKHGKVFLYGAEGDYTSDTHTSDGSGFVDTQVFSKTPINVRGNKDSFQRRKRSTRSALGRKLGALFPEAKSLMLLGLWNMSRDRWDAGCIVYSNSPIRVFSLESEMCYLKAFCDVITAKIGRLDMEMSHKVKSDFLSSISHELRSPLHGILGTAEFVSDMIHDHETSDMIGQIQVCGQTLLDVVDHLLDFSKVNSVSKHNRKQLQTSVDQRNRNRSAGLSRTETLGGMVVEKTNVLLDELTEEVIDTAVYSFCCSKDGQTLNQRKVTVITDIDPSALSLNCSIAVGAWKRLCINIINNALKYTERGYIVAALKLIPPMERQRRSRVRLTITDSGKGISKEFLTSQLFRAFAQEDDLSEGTGLGMSMVAKIVKNLGGHIDVQSKKDVGTTVAVTMPLDVRGAGDAQRIHSRTLSSGPNMISMQCLGFAPTEQYREKTIMAGRDFQIETLRKTCRQLNVMLSPSSWSSPSSFDLAMVTEEDVPELLRLLQPSLVKTPHTGTDTTQQLRTKPLLVICKNCRSRRDLKESALNQLVHGHIEYVAQPCGPRKLAAAIRRCLSNTPQDDQWSENTPTPPGTSLQKPSDPGYPFPTRRQSEDPNMKTPRPNDQKFFKDEAQDNKLPALPKDSPMAGSEQQTTVTTVTTKTTQVKTTTGTNVDPSKATLLLVDDNAVNLRLITAYAKKHGHAKLTATNGLEAFEAYKAAALGNAPTTPKPEVVLMDISMPVMDGFEATRQIRAFERSQDITPATIIALTGLGSAEAQEEAFVSGIDLFLTKPIKLDKLTKSLNEIREGNVQGGLDS
ncbi:hypothetical protein E4T43_01427 [Aureobasidium subglaciale]|nr:hypothetical protein E4T43_01427 [Aureobasidium subglaciale]